MNFDRRHAGILAGHDCGSPQSRSRGLPGHTQWPGHTAVAWPHGSVASFRRQYEAAEYGLVLYGRSIGGGQDRRQCTLGHTWPYAVMELFWRR